MLGIPWQNAMKQDVLIIGLVE